MKRLATLGFVAATFAFAAPAGAQAFGQLTPAHPLAGGGNLFGAYLLLGDRNDIGVLGQLRFTSSPRLNWGLMGGFSDNDPGDGAVLLGGDVRYQLQRASDDFPLDLAFDAAIGLTIADNVTILELGPQIQYSHRFPLQDSPGALTPYGSLWLDINHISIDLPPPAQGDADDTDLDLVARFGLEWELRPSFQITGEVEVGRGTNFQTGITVPF